MSKDFSNFPPYKEFIKLFYSEGESTVKESLPAYIIDLLDIRPKGLPMANCCTSNPSKGFSAKEIRDNISKLKIGADTMVTCVGPYINSFTQMNVELDESLLDYEIVPPTKERRNFLLGKEIYKKLRDNFTDYDNETRTLVCETIPEGKKMIG